MKFSKVTLARRLKFNQLAIFEKVLACGSLLAAARELHMTQPAISKAIQELEEHFGQPLLVRSSRGVTPTNFGLMLKGHAQSVMADLRVLADDLNAWNEGVSGKVMVGCLLAASAQLLPAAIVRLREMAPNVVVQVKVGVNEKMFPELLRGELDVVVGLIPAHEGSGEFTHVPLYTEKLCAVVGRQHWLATSVGVKTEQLAGLDWILPTSDSEAFHAIDVFFEKLGMPRPKQIVESVSIMTNLGLLVESDMVALMPFKAARRFVNLGLITILPIGVDMPFGEVGYTLAKDRGVTPAAQRLLMMLHDVTV
ncbi:LysR substrate-binding domain-containing protein [Kerstersia gyiorum]|uniref:LysR substrate-binding domain-containing protein n=1 Tax=Kerstersia gyiorum TaxID=206506 RepID=UPI00142FE01D|nr:LysR substrate-binding domain-containing protein [Kerstersia gyiorum]